MVRLPGHGKCKGPPEVLLALALSKSPRKMGPKGGAAEGGLWEGLHREKLLDRERGSDSLPSEAPSGGAPARGSGAEDGQPRFLSVPPGRPSIGFCNTQSMRGWGGADETSASQKSVWHLEGTVGGRRSWEG